MDGQRLFPDRHAVTVPFTLNGDEFALYKSVTAYINQYIPQQQGQRRTSAALARTVLQRRLASSACAIHESLQRRLRSSRDCWMNWRGCRRPNEAASWPYSKAGWQMPSRKKTISTTPTATN